MFMIQQQLSKKFGENLKKILFMQQSDYPYDYMDDWEKLSETSLPEKVGFYSNFIMEDITDADYAHVKELVKILK